MTMYNTPHERVGKLFFETFHSAVVFHTSGSYCTYFLEVPRGIWVHADIVKKDSYRVGELPEVLQGVEN